MDVRRLTRVALVLSAVALLSAGAARAEPKSGFGLFGGLATHSATAKVKPKFGSGDLSYQSSGLSIGFDYQFALTDWLTINPILLGSGETASGDLNPGTSVSHGVLGVDVRWWPGDFFLGIHPGNYSEVFTSQDSKTQVQGDGSGFGFTAGWESQGGLVLLGVLDLFSVSYVDADAFVVGARFNVGYRWK